MSINANEVLKRKKIGQWCFYQVQQKKNSEY